MLASKLAAAKPDPPPTPPLEWIAQQLGVDLVAEPELTHLVSEMRTTPLPPTWMAVATTSNGQPAAPEYVNRVTGERTQEHPGTSYFVSLVEQERCGNGHRGLGALSVLSAPSLQAPSHGCRNSSSDSAGVMNCTRSSSIRGPPQQEGGVSGAVSSISTDGDGTDEGQAVTSSGSDRASEVKVVRREKTQEVEDRSTPNSTERDGIQRGSSTAAAPKRTSSNRGKCVKRPITPPKWLVFTSWWHETTSGTENVMTRKHASIRYNTADGSFEVELEDVPAIFEVSHATGRHGKKIGPADVRVGAQISILGRQMRLMQCDGLTAQWLESEVRTITKAKAALISALEQGRDTVRVTCRSDRLELTASAQRGSGSVGHAAGMDRRALLQDVLILRDKLGQTQPEEAMRITKDLDVQLA